MSDLLAKCDWHGDELRVELPQWPEVVNVWVNGKAEPFVPVTDPDALGVIKCLQGLADATSAENEKLREELAKARDPQRIGGQADPSSFVYAIEQLREFRWQHATNDEDAIPYINNVAAAHERENAKLRGQLEEQKCFAADLEKDVRELRELVADMWPHVRHRSRMCGECELPCDTSDECLLYEPMRQRMRDLGCEVGE